MLEEVQPGESADGYLERIVTDKLRAAAALAQERASSGLPPLAGMLVADTVVVRDECILNKPDDVEHAAALFGSLTGRSHRVMTRFALAKAGELSRAALAETVTTEVTFRAATANEIRRYAESGEGLDKAGAYAVQGLGACFVSSLRGSYSNVVGLPLCEVSLALVALGLVEALP